MPFTVEDGSGVANANAYCDVAFADSYFSERAISAWTGADAVKQSAIIRATDYIELRYSRLFIGTQLTDTQGLAWPRTSVIVVNGASYAADPSFPTGVPLAVKRACAEYALRALSVTLAPDPVTDETGRSVVMSSEKVGPITETIQYAAGTAIAAFKPYPAADILLRGLIINTRTVVRN